MMFGRKKSHSISPLPPPETQSHSPASTSTVRHSLPPQANGGLTPFPPPGQGQGEFGTGRTQGIQGYASGPAVDRINSNTGSVRSDKEKRKSGLFGFGRHKDKEKDKVKEKEKEGKEEPRARSSFSVDRPASYVPNTNQQPTQDRQRQSIIPGPGQPSHFQPNRPPPQQQLQQQQISARQDGITPSPPGSGQVPKSQSMRFAPRPNQPLSPGQGQSPNGVPDTHPYRVNLTGQQQQQQNQGLPRSSTMPLDRQAQQPPSPSFPPPEPNRLSNSSPLSQPDRDRDGQGMNGGSASPARSSGSGSGSGQGQGPGGKGNGLAEFDRIVELIQSQPQKTYVASPPELEMILARTSAGGQPKQGQPGSASNDWDSVWLQLSGISLSMWSMKETRAAASKGEKVPPTYFNITDSSLELLAPLPPPPHRPTSHPHHFVFSLNTAGSNRLLFSCPSERDLARWATGLRLAAWERARLEEIYTGHLIKAGGREPASALNKGRLEGWVRVRVMGGTDWKRLWVVLHSPGAEETPKEDEKKGRRRSFFGMGDKQPEAPVQEPNTGVCMASFYNEPRTAKNRTSVVPVLTVTNVTQAYAVFPERLDVISQSNLFKVVGRVSGEMVTIEGRLRDSGWALIMPETSDGGLTGTTPNGLTPTPLANMMRWVSGFHDVFGLYGRPERYSWDQKDPKSLFFDYPQGDDRGRLFLELDEALAADFRSTSLAAVRAQFIDISRQRMFGETSAPDDDLPLARQDVNYRLPPLTFGQASPHTSEQSVPRSLTPITEQSIVSSRANSTATARTQSTLGPSGDRKTSGSSSKQGSSGSSKHQNLLPATEDRLAPIADRSTETFGQLTEEPSEHSQINSPDHTSPTTAVSGTAQTFWSQGSGTTPTMQSPQESQGPSPVTITPQPQQRSPTPTITPPATASAPASAVPAAAPLQAQAEAAAAPTSRGASPSSYPLAPALPLGSQPHTQNEGQNPPQVLSPTPRRAPSLDKLQSGDLSEEPAAMYLMNMVDDHHNASESAPTNKNMNMVGRGGSPEKDRPTIVTDLDGHKQAQTRTDLGRKPSGARAPPPKKNSGSKTLEPISDDPAHQLEQQPQQQQHGKSPSSATQADLGDDISAFINYADNPSPVKPKVALPAATQPKSSEPADNMRSSFAPSKAAAERRAKAEQSAADQERAKFLPGAGRRNRATTTDSSDEDEEEEEEDEVDSPVMNQRNPNPIPNHRTAQEPPVQRSTSTTRALPPVPVPNQRGGMPDPPEVRVQNGDERPKLESFYTAQQTPGSLDRNLAERAGRDRSPSRSPRQGFAASQAQGYGAYSPSQQLRNLPPQPQHQQAQAQPQSQQQQSQPGRHTVWNANFSADHGLPNQNSSGKFVELEEPSTQLTKAFAPHGLLQAGIQDKEDRSAKKQEEVARETGSSLINVPSKPPPPQAGLLGAVAAHERDRKGAGGIGAALTDREREKRVAEERQREIEKLQRQQMEHMRQYGGGDMYNQGQGQGQGYPYGMGMGGMGMNMNMGMMMPPMGYSPYQGGYNPYAQQQAMMAAQMAYQQAMMMSSAGSQAGEYPAPDPSSTPGSAGPGPGQQGQGQAQAQAQANGRGSPVGSMRSAHSPSPGFNPHMSFYGSPSPAPGYGFPSMPSMANIPTMGGMGGMGMPWMMPQPQMPWASPGLASGPASPMLNQGQGQAGAGGGGGYNWLSPNQTGQGGYGTGSSEGNRSRGVSMHSDSGGQWHAS